MPTRHRPSAKVKWFPSKTKNKCAVLIGLVVAHGATRADQPSVRDMNWAERPIVIAHRGASGERPEHTLAAYQLAIEQGADFIEPDLVPTRDGVLIARHENELSGTTDVADHAGFADRKTRKWIDGEAVEGWFSEDFTLAEIKTLRARERIPRLRPDNTRFDGVEAIPTLDEILALVRAAEARGRVVGIYPETKHPSYFAHEGHYLDGTPIARSLGGMLIDALVTSGFTDPQRVFIQSFELANLRELNERLMPAADVSFPLILLYGDLTPAAASSFSRPRDFAAPERDAWAYAGLATVLKRDDLQALNYADLTTPVALRWLRQNGIAGIGPWKDSLLLRASTPGEGSVVRLTGALHPLIHDARVAGLAVHPYTLRAEAAFLPLNEHGVPLSMEDELARLLAAGITGFFTDYPARGVAARNQHSAAAAGQRD